MLSRRATPTEPANQATGWDSPTSSLRAQISVRLPDAQAGRYRCQHRYEARRVLDAERRRNVARGHLPQFRLERAGAWSDRRQHQRLRAGFGWQPLGTLTRVHRQCCSVVRLSTGHGIGVWQFELLPHQSHLLRTEQPLLATRHRVAQRSIWISRSGRVACGCVGQNLTNEAYFMSVFPTQFGVIGQYAEPRTYGLNVGYSFGH